MKHRFTNVLIVSGICLLPVISGAQAAAEETTVAVVTTLPKTEVPTVEVPVDEIILIQNPVGPPLGVSISTGIELNEPDPLALTVPVPPPWR